MENFGVVATCWVEVWNFQISSVYFCLFTRSLIYRFPLLLIVHHTPARCRVDIFSVIHWSIFERCETYEIQKYIFLISNVVLLLRCKLFETSQHRTIVCLSTHRTQQHLWVSKLDMEKRDEREKVEKTSKQSSPCVQFNISKSMLLHSVVNHYNVLFDFSICLNFLLASFSSPLRSCLVCSFCWSCKKKNRMRRVKKWRNLCNCLIFLKISHEFVIISSGNLWQLIRFGSKFIYSIEKNFNQKPNSSSIWNTKKSRFSVTYHRTSTRMLYVSCSRLMFVWFIINSRNQEVESRVNTTRHKFQIHQQHQFKWKAKEK